MTIHRVSPNLYAIVHGVHPLAGKLLSLLNLSTMATSTGRFRDCYLQRTESGTLEIHVLTRNGGGNRAEYATITAALRTHPNYLRDFDERCDSTYATYVFGPTIGMLISLELALAANPDLIPKSFEERSKIMHERLQDPNDPEAKRIAEAMRPTMEAVANDPNGVQGVIDET